MRIIKQAEWILHADLNALRAARKIKKEHDSRRIHGSSSTEYYGITENGNFSTVLPMSATKYTIALSGRSRYTLREIYDKLTLPSPRG